MSTLTTYTQARANLARFCDEAAENHEIILIRRRKAEAVALIAASELSSLMETAHLLRSPKNARRLFKALHRAQKKALRPTTLKHLKAQLGLE